MLGKESIGYNIAAGCEKLIRFIYNSDKNKEYKKQETTITKKQLFIKLKFRL